MDAMGWEGYTTLGVLALVFGLLVFSNIAADIVMIGGLTILTCLGIVTAKEALSGLSNEGTVTVAVLFIVVAGLRDTGTIAWIGEHLFGRPKGVLRAQVRLMLPLAVPGAG